MKIVLFGLFLNGLVVLEGILAWRRKMFLPSQMRANGHPFGLPWIAHGGASWSDFFLLTSTVVAMMILCRDQWKTHDVWRSAMIACLATGVFHWIWSLGKIPDCLAWRGGWLWGIEPAGWVHVVYMFLTLTIVILFFFHTAYISTWFLILASIAVGMHIAIGNHMVLSLCAPKWWPINTLKDPGALTVTFGVWIALFLRCRYILAHR
jgi:hypothetical protein